METAALDDNTSKVAAMRRHMRHPFILLGLYLLLWTSSRQATASAFRRSPTKHSNLSVIAGEATNQSEALNFKRNDVALTTSRQKGRRRMRGSQNNDESRRQLGKGGSGGNGNGSSGGSGSSGSSSSGSGGSSSSGGSGAGWDVNGNYCGCLCDGTFSSKADIACEYAVHSGNPNSNSYGDNNQMQNANEQGNENAGNEGEGADNSNGDAGQTEQAANQNGGQSDIVAVVSTSDSNYNPFDAFNITEADTYCNLWSYDLLNSCIGGSCQCTYTEQLISKNLLFCSEAWDCPSSCPACLQCLKQVCGGSVTVITAVRTGTKALPAFLSLLTIVLAVCYIVPKRRNHAGELKESLIESDTEMSQLAGKTWMIPVSKVDGLPAEESDECKPVWLAPANQSDPMQTQPTPVPSSKQRREETAMLVVVPRPANNKERQKDNSMFSDVLKGSEDDDASTSDSAKDTGGNDMHQMHDEEFTPGLWLVPLSQESVTSSISESDDEDNLSIGSALDDDNDDGDQTHSSSIISNDDSCQSPEEVHSNFQNAVLVEGGSKEHSTKPPKSEYRLHDDSSFHSSKASTISSREEDDAEEEESEQEFTVGPGMGEI